MDRWEPGTESDADGAFPTPTITSEEGWWIATFADEAVRDGVLGMRGEVERLRKIEHAARRFYTFTRGGYRWEANDERRDALYDALVAQE
jgi:hypothetical protein